MAFDPTAAGSKWKDRLSQAATDGTLDRGVQAVTVSPGQAAARQADTWATNTVAAKSTWQKNVQVPLDQWKSDMLTKGKDRIATGATAAEPKMVQFLTKLAPVITGAKNALPPRGSYAQNKQRATQMMDALHAAKGSFK